MASIIFSIVETCITTISAMLNGLSLVYFIQYERKGISNQLLILLITLDFLFNLTYSVYHYFFFAFRFYSPAISLGYFVVYNFFMITTAITTTVLSVIRTVCIVYPFYHARASAIWVTIFVLFTSVLALLIKSIDIIFTGITYLVVCMTIFTTLVLLNALSGILSLRTLKKVDVLGTREGLDSSIKSRDHASVTILLLVLVFCVTTTIGFIGQTAFYLWIYGTRGPKGTTETDTVALWILSFFCVANSVFNPCVYMIRKAELRKYFATKWKRLWGVIVKSQSRGLDSNYSK